LLIAAFDAGLLRFIHSVIHSIQFTQQRRAFTKWAVPECAIFRQTLTISDRKDYTCSELHFGFQNFPK